jgi:hypothetical protein
VRCAYALADNESSQSYRDVCVRLPKNEEL